MINVIGLGYIGLPTALMLAKNGNKVIGTDNNADLVRKLQKGFITFEEAGLSKLFEEASLAGITFENHYVPADYYLVAVPTPYDKDSKKVNPKYLVEAIKGLLEVCKKGSVVIIESTISPKTIDVFVRPFINEHNINKHDNIEIVHAPERIIPGNMIYELENNSRTIGCDSKEIGERVKKIYAGFCKGEIIITDIRTAEMTKVVENTYRDINIAFANELAKICRHDNMDVYEIIKIANKHPRVNILSPGPGVGGHCISVDPWFLVGDYPGLANIILAARKINDSMPEFVLYRMAQIMEKHRIKNVNKVGLYGLTYKENVDDIRESPTLQLIGNMKNHLAYGARCFDPFVKINIVENQMQNFDEFVDECEMIVIMVAHGHILENMDKLADKIILDTRNVCTCGNLYKL